MKRSVTAYRTYLGWYLESGSGSVSVLALVAGLELVLALVLALQIERRCFQPLLRRRLYWDQPGPHLSRLRKSPDSFHATGPNFFAPFV